MEALRWMPEMSREESSMTLIIAILMLGHLFAGNVADERVPVQPSSVVMVELVIINFVRTTTETEDVWGRPRYTPNLTIWVSFWDYCTVPWIPSDRCLIARGWWIMSQVRSITCCSDGWIFESKDNVNIITPEIRLIDSDYDFEMRNRIIYQPIRKP